MTQLVRPRSCKPLRLVKESEAHVIVLFLAFLLRRRSGGRSGSRRGTSGSRSGGSSSATSGWDRAQLLGASGNDLFQILASKLLHNQSHLFAISLDSDRAQNLLDVGFVDILSSKGS